MTDAPTLQGENIIIFSSDDWWSGLKTSKYHVARQLARRNRVLFVNSIGLRAPLAARRDVGRVLHKLQSFVQGAVAVPEGLHVFTPVICPFRRGTGSVRALNSILLRAAMTHLQRQMGLWRPIVFSFLPSFNGVIGHLQEKAIVYYCIDNMRGYGGLDLEWYDREENWLLRRADCVIACSQRLQDDFRSRGFEAHYVPHGVDWTLFRKAVDEDLPLPDDMRSIPEPRLGFYGFLSEEVVDYTLLHRMARERPNWQIVLIGRPGATTNMAEVTRPENIHYLGLKRFEDLPAYTRHFAIGLMPFLLMKVTHNSNPLKMLEYLAGGLPSVSTDIPEVRRLSEYIHIARTHEEFIALCDRALTETDPVWRERRSRVAEPHSWDERVKQISAILANASVRGASGRIADALRVKAEA